MNGAGRLVEMGRFDNPVDAYLLLDVLTDAGIDARIFDEHTGSALPLHRMIGVRVVVRAQDAERAAAAIAEEKGRRGTDAAEVAEADWRGSGADEGSEEDTEEDTEDEDDAEEPGEGEAEPGEDERPSHDHSVADRGAALSPAPALPPREIELRSWAWKTRALACLGIAAWILAIGALLRVASPPSDIADSATASRLLRQARFIAWITLPINLVIMLMLLGVIRLR